MGTAASIQTSHPSQEQNYNKDENTISAPSWLTRRKSIKKKDIKEKMKAWEKEKPAKGMDEIFKFENLIFQGGGMKGIAYAGPLR